MRWGLVVRKDVKVDSLVTVLVEKEVKVDSFCYAFSYILTVFVPFLFQTSIGTFTLNFSKLLTIMNHCRDS